MLVALLLAAALWLCTTSVLQASSTPIAHSYHVGGEQQPSPAARVVAQATVTATWTQLDTEGAAIRRLGTGATGLLWLAAGSGEDPGEVIWAFDSQGRRLLAGARDEIIARDPDRIRRSGSMEGFWAIDASSRIWVGPRYFDGQRWTVIERSGTLPGGRIDFQSKGLVGPRSAVWVPFRYQGDCSLPQECQSRGLKSYGPEGPRQSLVEYAPLPEADRFGVDDVHLIGALDDDPARDQQAWIATRGAIYRLPDGSRTGFPLLEPGEPGTLRNAGYASEALRSPSGSLQSILWVEEQVPEGVAYRVLLATWDAGRGVWRDLEDLADVNGLAGADPKLHRIVSAAWGPWDEGASVLWCVISDGRLAIYRDGGWIQSWRPEELGASRGSRALAVLAAKDFVVLATDRGALRRASSGPVDPGPTHFLYIPRVDVRR